jgi:NAD(P)H-hydrate epimerase
MEKVITVEAMRKSDAYTIENFIDSKELMYKAGKGVFESVPWSGSVAIVCGSGNNAGDGYVLGNLFKENGIDCKLFLIKEKFSPDGKFYFEKCLENNIPYEVCNDNTSFKEYKFIVDCILGTGFKGKVRGIAGEIIHKINNSQGYVVAVDINSGLNGDTGMAENAVISDLTVSIGYLKTGHFINDAQKYIGKIVNCDIDIVLQGDYYILKEKNKILSTATVYENIEEFYNKCNIIDTDVNPVKAIADYGYVHNENLLVKNLGEYSVLVQDNKTYLLRG